MQKSNFLLIIVVLIAAGIAIVIFFATTTFPLSNNNSDTNTGTAQFNDTPIKIADVTPNATSTASSSASYPPLKINETGIFVYQDPANVGIGVEICGTSASGLTKVPGNPEHPAIVKRRGDEIAIPICYGNKNTVEMTWRVRAEGWPSPVLDKGIIARLDKESFRTAAVSSVLDEYLASKAITGNFTAFVRADDTASLGKHIIVITTERRDDRTQGYTGIGLYTYIYVKD